MATDPNGGEIGGAVRIEDRYSRVGYQYHYELGDGQLRCVVRNVTRPRSGWACAFSVLGSDGAEIATITRSATDVNDSYVIASDRGRPLDEHSSICRKNRCSTCQ